MKSQNNVLNIILFGKNTPIDGRIAMDEEIQNIQNWVRTAEEVVNDDNDPIRDSRIIINVISGSPMQIRPIGTNSIELIGVTGRRRVLHQKHLREFLEQL